MRVSAHNVLGFGPVKVSLYNVVPAGKSGAPTTVRLVTPSSQVTPISTTDVSWAAPSTSNGAAINGYLIEWYEPLTTVPDVQLVQFISGTFPLVSNGFYSLSFGPQPGVVETTSLLSYLSTSANVRSELINLGFIDGLQRNFTFSDVIGNIDVARSSISGAGYQWKVTFLGPENQGNQVLITGKTVALASSGEQVLVSKFTSGRRAGGFNEIQLITIFAQGQVGDNVQQIQQSLGGYFRLSFNQSLVSTAWLPVTASAALVARAISQLATLRAVTVTLSVLNITESLLPFAGYQWTVTFSGDYGDQPALLLESSYLTTTKAAILASVSDGNNQLNTDGSRLTNAVPGELPAKYRSALVGPDVRTYTLTNLVPGNQYSVQVSAINSYGTGAMLAAPAALIPSKQIPQPPVNVTVNVHPGSSSSLDVAYGEPPSDGGAKVLFYRVELDTTPQFTNPIHTLFTCPTDNMQSTYSIKTNGSFGNPIIGGSFQLALSRNGSTFYTDAIPYDATAVKADEVGVRVLIPGVTATLTNAQSLFTTNVDTSLLIFPGDRLQFVNDRFPDESFVVHTVPALTSLTPLTVTVNATIFLPIGTGTITANVYRYIGGRGKSTTSRVGCTPDGTLCPLARQVISGSIESKLQNIPDALMLGVEVNRQGPDSTNGYTWAVTFLDQALPGATNFVLAAVPSGSALITKNGNPGELTITRLMDGSINPVCTGIKQVPAAQTLTIGQLYYSRVFAINEVGYSLPQISPSAQKPMLAPGPPTGVALSVFSGTELRVEFAAPSNDGGDLITSYQIDYSVRSDFIGALSVFSTFLAAGSPYTKVFI